MRDRLDIGGVRGGPTARLQPIGGGAVELAGRGQMMRKHLRSPLHRFRGLVAQSGRDPQMQPLTRTTEQGSVGGILHEGMLELVFGRRRYAALENEARPNETFQPLTQ